MKIGILAVTEGGKKLAAGIAQELEEATFLDPGKKIAVILTEYWHLYDGFICIMATGIVVRALAPLVQDKRQDPCVVVMDEKGKHSISLLSGHLGGGNELARRAAAITGGRPVITTASDTLDLVSLDLWARDSHLFTTKEMLTRASSELVNRGRLKLYCDEDIEQLPQGLEQTEIKAEADIIIAHECQERGQLVFHPKNLVVGVGCNRGTPLEEFEEALQELLDDLRYSPFAIRNLASIDLKNDEEGLMAFARKNGWQIDFFSKEEINTLSDLEISHAALKAVGAIGVAEPTALLSAQNTLLLSRKRKWQNITMAVAQAPFTL